MLVNITGFIVKQAYAADPLLEEWGTDSRYVRDTDVAGFQALEPIFRNILAVAGVVGVIVCFIMLMAGGFRFMTSGGDPKKTAAAGATMTYAVLGLVLFIGAWFVMRFIKEFTGVDVSTFDIPSP